MNINRIILKKAVNSIVYGKSGISTHRNSSNSYGNLGKRVIPALITAGNSTDGFTCRLYENGIDSNSTGYATGIKCLDIAIADSTCIGEYVYLFSNSIIITSGT